MMFRKRIYALQPTENALKEVRMKSHELKRPLQKLRTKINRLDWLTQTHAQKDTIKENGPLESADFHQRVTKEFQRSTHDLEEIHEGLRQIYSKIEEQKDIINVTDTQIEMAPSFNEAVSSLKNVNRAYCELGPVTIGTEDRLEEWKNNISSLKNFSVFSVPHFTEEDEELVDFQLAEQGIKGGLKKAVKFSPFV